MNLAGLFHEAYERLAPSFGYETRQDSRVPWDEVPENNRRLMEAVADEVRASVEGFRFRPRQKVVVQAFGLKYRGRVNRCVFDGGPLLYNVEYAADGKIETREFYEDELSSE